MKAYTRPYESGDLTEAYIKAYPRLRVFGQEASIKQVREQGTEIESLQNRIRELEAEKEAESTALRQEFEDFKRMIFEEMRARRPS